MWKDLIDHWMLHPSSLGRSWELGFFVCLLYAELGVGGGVAVAAASPNPSVLTSSLVVRVCQVSSIPPWKARQNPPFGQPPEKLGHWSCRFFPSPGRSWVLGFLFLCSVLSWGGGGGRGNGNCLPTSLYLFSLAFWQLDFSRSHQHSEARQKPFFWVAPVEIGVLSMWTNSFFSQEEAMSWNFSSICSYAELQGGAMVTTSTSHYFSSPPVARLCQFR